MADIPEVFVNSYKANIDLKYQQMGSRARKLVRVEMQHSLTDFYDRIGPTEVVEVTDRHGDTPLIATDFDRRAVTLRDFEWADLIDRVDKLRMLADPTSAYVMNAMSAMGRNMDSVICTAATATAYSGSTGTTAVTFPAGQTVAVNYVESGGAANSNLTVGKLRRGLDILKTAEAVEEGEQINVLCAQSQITSLLRTTEVTSHDYNEVKALVSGTVNSFLGCTFTRTQKTLKSGNNRSVLMFPQRAITLAMAQDITTRVTERSDKRYSTQVYVCASFNAVRMWEEQVVEILCDETA